MKKYKTGLVVGRFQPFHLGHLYLLKAALEKADKIIIAIGSSDTDNSDNPLSYKTRVKMLKKVIEQEKLEDKVKKIVPSPDHPSDDIWLEKLSKNAGKFDVEIGNNDWVNGIFEKANLNVIKIPYFKRDIYQGIFIRKLFRERKKWENRVPKYLTIQIQTELTKAL